MLETPNSLLKRTKADLQAEAETLHAALGMPAEESNRFADMDKSQLLQEVIVMKAIQDGCVRPTTAAEAARAAQGGGATTSSDSTPHAPSLKTVLETCRAQETAKKDRAALTSVRAQKVSTHRSQSRDRLMTNVQKSRNNAPHTSNKCKWCNGGKDKCPAQRRGPTCPANKKTCDNCGNLSPTQVRQAS